MKETSRHKDAFEAWCALGRNWSKTAQNSAISRTLLYAWADRFDWHERADKRDAESQRIIDEEAAKERAARQKRRRQSGELLTARGAEFLRKYEIDSARDAIRAIQVGTELERKEDGLPDFVVLALNADENAIQRKRAEIFAELERRNRLGGGDGSLSDDDGAFGGDGDDE